MPVVSESDEALQQCACVEGSDEPNYWLCNGSRTPECPAGSAESLNGTACDEYVASVQCYYDSIAIGGAMCRCGVDEKWLCASFQPPMTN